MILSCGLARSTRVVLSSIFGSLVNHGTLIVNGSLPLTGALIDHGSLSTKGALIAFGSSRPQRFGEAGDNLDVGWRNEMGVL